MPPIQIGTIGCGGRLRGLLGLLAKHPEQATVTAMVDPSDDAINKTRKIVGDQARRFDDVPTMLAESDVTWVMIGSPNALHREHAVAALEAGRHVFCEKPLATSLGDAVAMRDAVVRNDRRFVVGFTLRFSPHYRAIRKLIDDGVIGKLLSFEFNETLDFNHGGFIHADWRRHRHIAGTHLLEKCSHDFDLANWFIGARVMRAASFGGLSLFTPASAHLQTEVGPHPDNQAPAYQGWMPNGISPFNDDKSIVDHQVAILEYDNGVRAMFHTHCASAIPERRMVLIGDRGAIRADVMAGKIEYRKIGWNTPMETVDANASGGHGGGDKVLIAELLDVMHGRGEPAATVDDGLASALTCFAVDRAMDDGTVVEADDLWRQVDASWPH